MKLGKHYYLVYIIVLEWLELKTIVICLKLRAKFLFVFLSFFGTFSLKAIQTMFVWHETWHTILFGIYCCFEMVTIEKKSYA